MAHVDLGERGPLRARNHPGLTVADEREANRAVPSHKAVALSATRADVATGAHDRARSLRMP